VQSVAANIMLCLLTIFKEDTGNVCLMCVTPNKHVLKYVTVNLFLQAFVDGISRLTPFRFWTSFVAQSLKKAQNIETRDGGQNKRTEWY